MFLHVSVILFTGGGGLLPGGGAWSWGGSALRGCLVWGVCSRGVSALGGVCFRGEGVPGPRGGVLPGGVLPWGGLLPGGMPGGDPPGTATAAGGTHPTGMHSCLLLVVLFKVPRRETQDGWRRSYQRGPVWYHVLL